MTPASSSTSPISQLIIDFPHLMEFPDPNRFTSTPEYRQLMDTTSSKCSSDILSTTKYYLATDDDVEEHELTDPGKEDDIMCLGQEDLLRLKAEMMAGLPPLPLEGELFTPLVKSVNAGVEKGKQNKEKSTVRRTNPP